MLLSRSDLGFVNKRSFKSQENFNDWMRAHSQPRAGKTAYNDMFDAWVGAFIAKEEFMNFMKYTDILGVKELKLVPKKGNFMSAPSFSPFVKDDEDSDIKKMPMIDKIIFNDRTTVVVWLDKTKTIVKCSENDIYDKEKAVMAAILQRVLGLSKTAFSKLMDIYTTDGDKVKSFGFAERISSSIKLSADDLDGIDDPMIFSKMMNEANADDIVI